MATLREIRERRAKQKKPSLADLRARKQEQKAQSNGLDAIRQRKRSKKTDLLISGIRYHNARPHALGYWMIDVSNGDKTYTLHNRCGAWFHNVDGREGWMKEPAWVARALGTEIGQLEISTRLNERLEREFKERGIPTREQLARQREEQAKAERRKRKKHDDD